MTDRELMQQALEALEEFCEHQTMLRPIEKRDALRERLAQPEKEWVGLTDEEHRSIREWQRIQEELGPVWAPMMLYLYEAIEAKLKEKNNG